jgi:acetyl esterase/lipase
MTAVIALSLTAGAQAELSPNNEWGMPAARVHKAPVGWVMIIHGGGWQVVGKEQVIASRPQAAFFSEHGWGTYNIDYRAGSKSLSDVLSAYDHLRKRAGRHAPVCAWGGSAGGHLAMMLAAFRPTVDCVISEAGPTDLLTFPHESAWAPPGVPPTTGPDWIFDTFVIPSFSDVQRQLWWWSPVRWASRIEAHMLLGASTYDDLVPQEQMYDMEKVAHALTTVMLLPGTPAKNPTNFTHASVTAAAKVSWIKAELAILHSTQERVAGGNSRRRTANTRRPGQQRG